MLTNLVIILGTLLFVSLLGTILVISVHNRLTGLHGQCEDALTHLAEQLQSRHEVIRDLTEQFLADPSLAEHDRATISRARQVADSASQLRMERSQSDHDQLMRLEEELEQSLRPLVSLLDTKTTAAANEAVADTADRPVREVLDELQLASSKVEFARDAYNEFVGHYNARRHQFPVRLLASRLGFEPLRQCVHSDDHLEASREDMEP